MRNQTGFTLIEILVALAIVMVLVTILYETFNAVIRSIRQVEEVTEIDQMARISLSIISKELRSTYWGRPDPGGTLTPGIFIGLDGEDRGQPSDTLRFTALSNARASDGITDPSLSILEYELVPASNAETSVLIHREETNLMSLSGRSLEQFELAERVTGLNFRYYDGQEWKDEWTEADQNKLPKAVEIRIFFKDLAGRERQFITQTDIPIGRTL